MSKERDAINFLNNKQNNFMVRIRSYDNDYANAVDTLDQFITQIEQKKKDGTNYLSKCDGLLCAYSKVEKGTKDYERINKLSNFIDYRMEENEKMENTLLYVASLIRNGTFNNFVNTHYNKDVEDIVSDMEYEMENNFVNDNDDNYYEPKTKTEYL